MLTSKLFNKLWYTNGKTCTVMTYVYLVLGALSLTDDLTTALMFAVMAELSKVDKPLRFLALYDLDAIIYDCEHPEDGDKRDDEDEQ